MDSFITDVLVFIAALVTVVITFIIIYMLTGQSKLKRLVVNIVLQYVIGTDALNPRNQGTQSCDNGMLKFLMILNLAIVVLMILGIIIKIKIFQGHFSPIW